jgi:hypothetical protein
MPEPTITVEVEPTWPIIQRKKDKWRAWATATNQLGQAITLRRGRDFDCTVATMQVQAADYARANGYVHATKIIDKDTIKVQFHKREAAEPK